MATRRKEGTRATLMVHTGGIGDLLLTCPALERLASEGPVELAGNAGRLALAVAGGLGRAAYDLDAIGFDSALSDAPSPRLAAFLKRFDRAVVWMRDDGALARAFRGCGVGDFRAFPGLPVGNGHAHASEYYLRCLGYEAGPPLRLAIAPSSEPCDVVIHAGSGSKLKNWPVDRFAEVAEWLAARGRGVEWSTGPAEEGLYLPSGAQALPAMGLVELGRCLAAARLYLGNDSGITHLAAAVGCPVVAVFGPTEPAVWAPLGGHVHVVRGDPWPAVEEVVAAVERACTVETKEACDG